mmetsp:Transcript_662/g.1473  ORF Transcript_662/g.1473 Transcript_662/m.1473 type:complete len:83 (-) Transcript_662:716-964(-)
MKKEKKEKKRKKNEKRIKTTKTKAQNAVVSHRYTHGQARLKREVRKRESQPFMQERMLQTHHTQSLRTGPLQCMQKDPKHTH